MAGMGMGVTLLAAFYVRSEIGSRDVDVKVVRMDGPRILRLIGLLVRKSLASDGAAQKVASMIQSVARTNFEGLIFLEKSADTVGAE